jgi:hypothetical protein
VEKKTLRRADLVMSIILLLFAGFVFIMSYDLLRKTLANSDPDYAIWYRSAGLVPMIISFLLGVCAVFLFLKARSDGARFDFFTKDKVKGFFTGREFKVAISIIGLLAVYIFVLLGPVEEAIYNLFYSLGLPWFITGYVPYILMTFIFLGSFMIIFNKKKKKEIILSIIISLITSVIIAFLFGDLAMILLP